MWDLPMAVRNLAFLGLTQAFAIPICAYAAGALPTMEEIALRSAVLDKCHTVLTDDDKTYEKAALASMQAEGRQILERLSVADPSNLDNSGKSMEILVERFSKLLAAAKVKVEDLDCAELERQTKPTGHYPG